MWCEAPHPGPMLHRSERKGPSQVQRPTVNCVPAMPTSAAPLRTPQPTGEQGRGDRLRSAAGQAAAAGQLMLGSRRLRCLRARFNLASILSGRRKRAGRSAPRRERNRVPLRRPRGVRFRNPCRFECGFLGWNGHDLLVTTGHLPRADGRHYALAKRHGLLAARDGLPWRHDPLPRLALAAAMRVQVIWDLSHYDPPQDPVGHARRVAVAAGQSGPLWLCPVNEP